MGIPFGMAAGVSCPCAIHLWLGESAVRGGPGMKRPSGYWRRRGALGDTGTTKELERWGKWEQLGTTIPPSTPPYSSLNYGETPAGSTGNSNAC